MDLFEVSTHKSICKYNSENKNALQYMTKKEKINFIRDKKINSNFDKKCIENFAQVKIATLNV